MSTARILHAHLHLLDRQVLREDDGALVCKVDDLEMALDDSGRPYVTAILAGPLALGPRIGGLPGWLMVQTTELFRPEEDPGPQRIPMEFVSDIGSAIKIGGDPVEPALERWARVNFVAPIPGSNVRRGESADRRPERTDEARGGPRLGLLLKRPVMDASGTRRGHVVDVRLSQDGPMVGQTQQALSIAGLIVSTRHSGQLFGYERSMNRLGPAPVRALIRRVYRDARYATWEQVADLGDAIRLTVEFDRLLPLAELPDR